MSGNFVHCKRERQRIVTDEVRLPNLWYCLHIYSTYIIYVNNTLPLAHEISRHFWAAYVQTVILKPNLVLLYYIHAYATTNYLR